MGKRFLVLFFKKEPLDARGALGRLAMAGLALFGSGCAATPKLTMIDLLKKLVRISDLSEADSVAKSVDLGVPIQPVTHYYMDKSGAQKKDFVDFVTRAPVTGVPGVTITQYEVAFAGGTAVPAPEFDDQILQTRISFVADPLVACVKLDDLRKNFGDDPKSTSIPGGWGTSYAWSLRRGSHYSTTMSASFGADPCATLVTVRQIRAG